MKNRDTLSQYNLKLQSLTGASFMWLKLEFYWNLFNSKIKYVERLK